MTNINATTHEQAVWSPGNAAIISHLFGATALVADLLVTIAVSVAVGVGYHLYIYAEVGQLMTFVRFGSLIALFYLVIQFVGKRYEILEIYQDGAPARRTFRAWTLAFFCTLCVAFLLKEMNIFSRGSVILLYMAGLAALISVRWSGSKLARLGLSRGWFAPRRVLLLGTDQEIQDFFERNHNSDIGVRFEGMVALPQSPSASRTSQEVEHYRNTLREIAEQSRNLQIDEILFLIPWSNKSDIEMCIDAFMCVPSAIHLGPEKIFSRYKDIEFSRIGNADTLRLTRAPLSPIEVLAKRSFDVVVAIGGLIALAPFLALIALLIKLDSGGHALFTQNRHGFNQRPFRIFKFRTMTSSDDGEIVPQATPNDPRITRVGKFLRRWNIDELPQLVNVLTGDMSIVGPRPHAVAHNNEFEVRIALYARRHNVKPGITGWAQIHGLRGRTETVGKMRARIEHDIYYIDNWSFWLDLYIIAMTAFSARAFRNAG